MFFSDALALMPIRYSNKYYLVGLTRRLYFKPSRHSFTSAQYIILVIIKLYIHIYIFLQYFIIIDTYLYAHGLTIIYLLITKVCIIIHNYLRLETINVL